MDFVAVGGYAIAVVVFLGAAAVFLKGSADKGTLESQGRLIDTRGKEVDDLTRRLTAAELRIATLETENAKLKLENNTLTGAVSHVQEIVEMQATLDRNHSEEIAVLGRILVALEALAA